MANSVQLMIELQKQNQQLMKRMMLMMDNQGDGGSFNEDPIKEPKWAEQNMETIVVPTEQTNGAEERKGVESNMVKDSVSSTCTTGSVFENFSCSSGKSLNFHKGCEINYAYVVEKPADGDGEITLKCVSEEISTVESNLSSLQKSYIKNPAYQLFVKNPEKCKRSIKDPFDPGITRESNCRHSKETPCSIRVGFVSLETFVSKMLLFELLGFQAHNCEAMHTSACIPIDFKFKDHGVEVNYTWKCLGHMKNLEWIIAWHNYQSTRRKKRGENGEIPPWGQGESKKSAAVMGFS